MSDSTFSESDKLKAKNESDDAKAEVETPETAPLQPEVVELAQNKASTDTKEIVNIGNRPPRGSVKEPTLLVAKRCGLGAVRERNEDACLVFVAEAGGHFSMIPFGLYIVADGMGGHTNGHVASNIAARVAAKYILERIYIPLLNATDSVNQAPIQEVLVNAVQAANTAVYENEPEVDSGTTLTVALIFGRRLHVAHVGDSRLYLHTDERFEAVTIDHSLVQRLQDVGQLTAEEASLYRYKNVLLRAVGQGEDVEIDTYMRLLPKHGKLLLCSDGLCGFVSDKAIQETLDQDMSLKAYTDTLYDSAMAAGGFDNITAVVVDFSF
ncbi:MAG: serine/threonine-protein phosphatase [Chloroflexi bacterium]|nr:serine/threonine-protein phosphatase [Chloroflexota bacterium]